MSLLNNNKNMADKHYRSLIKAISWRVTGTVDTIVVSYFVTGKVKTALAIGLVEVFTKIMLYYGHERVWERLSFGRVREARKDKPNFDI